jgi:hypothetical protein
MFLSFMARKRRKSVPDTTEEDFGFSRRCFAERDNADFMLCLGVRDGNGYVSKQAKRYETLLTIGKPIIFEGKGYPFKYERGINKVQTVDVEVALTLDLTPRKLHIRSVYTLPENCKRRLTLELSGCRREELEFTADHRSGPLERVVRPQIEH